LFKLRKRKKGHEPLFSVKEREGLGAGRSEVRIEGRSATDKLIRHSFLRFHKPHKK
jgi:hypothetical protein